MTVYKYMNADIGGMFLKNWSIAFRQPARFNDPFDCRPGLFTRTEEERRTRVEILAKQNLTRGFNEESARGYAAHYANWEERDLHGQVSSMISSGLFYVTCFTRTKKHPLMWSHYAESHTGLLIGFREDCELLQGRLNPVVYSDARPSFSLFREGADVSEVFEAVEKRFSLVKGLEWAYEQESRIVLKTADARQLLDFSNPDSNIPRLAKLKKIDVEVIVFGCRFDSGVIKTTVDSLLNDSSTSHIKLYKSVPDQHEFKLNYVPVEEVFKSRSQP